jgi:seryl-tRNA synthetase
MLDFTQFYEFMTSEIGRYAITGGVAFISTLGSLIVERRKTKKVVEESTTVLSKANENSNKTVGIVERTNTAVENTRQALEAMRKEIKEEREQLAKDIETMKEIFENQKAQLEEFAKTLEPLLKLPQAFAQSVSLNSESVKNGTARKVNDILGFNKDNLQTNATQNTKANNLFKGIQLNTNNKKQEEEEK